MTNMEYISLRYGTLYSTNNDFISGVQDPPKKLINKQANKKSNKQNKNNQKRHKNEAKNKTK